MRTVLPPRGAFRDVDGDEWVIDLAGLSPKRVAALRRAVKDRSPGRPDWAAIGELMFRSKRRFARALWVLFGPEAARRKVTPAELSRKLGTNEVVAAIGGALALAVRARRAAEASWN